MRLIQRSTIVKTLSELFSRDTLLLQLDVRGSFSSVYQDIVAFKILYWLHHSRMFLFHIPPATS
jgi:hypothetical protein